MQKRGKAAVYAHVGISCTFWTGRLKFSAFCVLCISQSVFCVLGTLTCSEHSWVQFCCPLGYFEVCFHVCTEAMLVSFDFVSEISCLGLTYFVLKRGLSLLLPYCLLLTIHVSVEQ